MRQFFLLTRRYFDLILRDRVLLTVLFAIMPLLALLVLLITGPNWLIGDSAAAIEQQLLVKLADGGQSATYSVASNSQALLFIFSLAAVMLGLFASAYEIVKERTIYERERMVFLRLPPYLGSKLVLLMGFASIQCLFFLVVIGYKLHFPQDGMLLPAFAEIYLTLLIGSLSAILLGLLLSSISPNSNVVVYLILGVLFLQILFAGVLFDLPGGAGQLSKITLTRWSTEALGITTDLKYLDSLTTTRFIPGIVTQNVSVEVDAPAPDWTPVTITTEMQVIPGCSQAVPVPVVTENALVNTQETVTKTVSVTPDPMDVHPVRKFVLDYSRNAAHLLEDWGVLLGLGLLCSVGTTFILKKRDIV